MILHAFRKHLADELEKLPSDPEQPFESYMVTTAALARQCWTIGDRGPDVFERWLGGEAAAYPLRKVLDRILHFRALHQTA